MPASQLPQELHRAPEHEAARVTDNDRSSLERRRRSARGTADFVVWRLDRHVQTVGIFVDPQHPTFREPDHPCSSLSRVGDEGGAIRLPASVHPERLRPRAAGAQ
jgi:hypothetical protein